MSVGFSLADHSEVETAGTVKRASDQGGRELRTAGLGQGCMLAAGRTVETGAAARPGGLGTAKESSGQVVLRHCQCVSLTSF
jgi:hypothetical protein